MDIQQIRELVAILEKSSLVELTIEEGESKIHLSRKGELASPLATSSLATALGEAVEEDTDEDYITSPIVGTFYSAAGPDIPAFARVGDKLKAGETICILEAMKMMNEITVGFDCEVEAILVSNEQKVEYGQPLFRIKKL